MLLEPMTHRVTRQQKRITLLPTQRSGSRRGSVAWTRSRLIQSTPTERCFQHSAEAVPLSCQPLQLLWFYSSATTMPQVDHMHWNNKKFLTVGGSTSSQMYEQLLWEMPMMKDAATFSFGRFLFHFEKGCCKYNRSHGLDLRRLAQNLREGLKATGDYAIFNTTTWWPRQLTGHVIDEKGFRWDV
jgi:hypothetical protein